MSADEPTGAGTTPDPGPEPVAVPEQTMPEQPSAGHSDGQVPVAPPPAEPPDPATGDGPKAPEPGPASTAAPAAGPRPTPADQGGYRNKLHDLQSGETAEEDRDGTDTSWNGAGQQATAEAPADPPPPSVLSQGVTAIGPNAQAYNIVLAGEQRITVLRSHRTETWIKETQETYVTDAGFEQNLRVLADHRLLYLRAPVGSGRRTTAEMMLARLVGNGRVAGIEVSQDSVSLAEIAGQPDLLVADHGIVLELVRTGTVRSGTLGTLATLARDCRAYVVVLDDRAGSPDPSLRPYEILHTRPGAEPVLRRHLTWRLGQAQRCVGDCQPCQSLCHQDFVDRCLGEELVLEQLRSHPQPGEVTELAMALAEWSGVTEDLERALGGLRARLRALAAQLLKADSAGPESDKLPAAPRRQAFQIAYAVFDGFPLADAFRAGEVLLQILWAAQYAEERPTRVVFDGGVDQMLQSGLGAVGTDEPTEVAEHPLRARLSDPRLLVDVLDVVWNDFDGTRLPLLLWLNELVLTQRNGVPRRAAQLVGWLARYDFHEVYRLLLSGWARSGKSALRQAAAWALDIAAGDSRLLGQVRQQTHDWVRSSSPRLHDAAARTYGTRVGAVLPEDALRDLRVLAGRDDLNGSASVAFAMRALYLVAPDQTRVALIEWNREELYRVRVHAARALTLLARLAADEPHEGWPLLLADTVGVPEQRQGLIELWRNALIGPTTAYPAWAMFRNWLYLADTDPAIADEVVSLACPVLAGQLATRGRFHLRTWKSATPPCETARRLLELPWA
ncbi:hypothetical protein BDK92_1521 [Micromonospora pisi]|uniref:Uncharacterized protein n=1 Tax=Micromonospora pisi TaxID=589240 RepID=A0A495JED0_9ACTN|nr:hypothetical protein [Micromonospora pisi]RKR87247.1 hypothetical protein BDK92_1521 [Micromonospora pisi]